MVYLIILVSSQFVLFLLWTMIQEHSLSYWVCRSLSLFQYTSEFPLWLSGLGIQHNVWEVASSIPGLTRWVNKNPVLPGSAVWVTDAAWIRCYYGCGVTPAAALIQSLAWELLYAAGEAIKKKKKKKKKKDLPWPIHYVCFTNTCFPSTTNLHCCCLIQLKFYTYLCD